MSAAVRHAPVRMPHSRAMCLAVWILSPVTMRTVMPARWQVTTASGTSLRTGSYGNTTEVRAGGVSSYMQLIHSLANASQQMPMGIAGGMHAQPGTEPFSTDDPSDSPHCRIHPNGLLSSCAAAQLTLMPTMHRAVRSSSGGLLKKSSGREGSVSGKSAVSTPQAGTMSKHISSSAVMPEQQKAGVAMVKCEELPSSSCGLPATQHNNSSSWRSRSSRQRSSTSRVAPR